MTELKDLPAGQEFFVTGGSDGMRHYTCSSCKTGKVFTARKHSHLVSSLYYECNNCHACSDVLWPVGARVWIPKPGAPHEIVEFGDVSKKAPEDSLLHLQMTRMGIGATIKPEFQKWEYLAVGLKLHDLDGAALDSTTAILNGMGIEGWEVAAASSDVLVFKRTRSS